MNYVELDIPVSGEEIAEILTAELADWPFDSFAAEHSVLKAYIPQAALADCKEEVDALLDRYGVERRYVLIEQQNWNALWESNFEEVDIDGRAVVRAPFHAPHPEYGDLDIVIMPKMSFGTGHHATTRLMCETVLDADVAGKRVLDMGSGTGVLAILAAKRGAVNVDAVDIDDIACENCRDNIVANRAADSIEVIEGDIRSVAMRRYDFILANINRNILLRDMPAYAASLEAGGRLAMSGFLEQDIPSITDRAASLGLKPAATRMRDGWVAVEFERP